MNRNSSLDKPQISKKQQYIPPLSRVNSQHLISLSQLDTETCSETPRTKTVKFSQSLTQIKLTQKKRGSSILKQTKFIHRSTKTISRTDSVSSLCGHNPRKDDQSCENPPINKNIKSEYDNIMKMLSNKQLYQDTVFPAVQSSIVSKLTKNKKSYSGLKWMRISELFKGRELVIVGSDPSKNLIIGSCLVPQYFTLGMNCIKYSKNALNKIFEDQKVKFQGIYYLKIFHGNIWKLILIDDYIPVVQIVTKKGSSYEPAFISSESFRKSNGPIQIWPFLLEKAFAKLYSGYSNLSQGNVFDFLEQLTNYSYEFINLESQIYNFKELFEYKSVIGFGETKQCEKVPIQIGVGQSNKIMFLHKERRLLVEWKQLRKYFEGIYVFSCRNYSYVGYCPVKQVKESTSIRKFKVPQKTKCSITLYQKDERHYQTITNHQYSWIRLILLQKQYQDFSYRWITGRYQHFKSISIEQQLQTGQYLLLIRPEWENVKQIDFNLIIRCSIPIILQRQGFKPVILEEGCTDLAQRYGVINQLNKDICSYNCIHQDMGMIIENFNNEREHGYVRITKKINEAKGNKLKLEAINEQFKKSNKSQINIKGGEHYTLVMMTKGGVDKEGLQSFNFTV